MKPWLLRLLQVVFWAFIGSAWAFNLYQCGARSARREVHDANECYCGNTRTCPFGPGIVGEQHCTTSMNENKWTRCEPVPVKEGK